MPRQSRLALSLLLLSACLARPVAAGEDHRFCGGPVKRTVPNDLENVVGELTIEYISERHGPDSMMGCGYGYAAEKCGDHETANRIYDRCIAAGHVGAMLWKALLFENGNGVPLDLAKAAALYRKAGESGTSGYATLGKLHYATALLLGRGVERDEHEARRWFAAAAAEGDRDAAEFLRTGYHTAQRDGQGRGVGTPPAGR